MGQLQTLSGIYELSGDRLRIAWRAGGPRPNEFKSEPGSGVTLIELVRKEPETPTEPTSTQAAPSPVMELPPPIEDTEPDRPDAAQSLRAFQGLWEVVSVEQGKAADFGRAGPGFVAPFGQPFDPADIDRVSIEENLSLYDFDKGRMDSFDYLLNPVPSPGTVDLLSAIPHAPTREKQLQAVGVYELEEQSLKICLTRPLRKLAGGQRPEDFQVESDSADVLFTLRRYQFSPDEKAIHGHWHFASLVVDGSEVPADGEQEKITLSPFSPWHYFLPESLVGRQGRMGLYVLDTSCQPKAITLSPYGWTQRSAEAKPLHGIYELDGDRLRIAWRAGGPRPKEFKSEPGSGVTLMELARPEAPAEAHPNHQAIQGVWQAVAATFQGEEMASEPFVVLQIAFAQGRYRNLQPTFEERPSSGSYVLDPTRNPKWIDFIRGESPESFPAIYELSGDRLRLCFGGPTSPRPTGFVSEKEPPNDGLLVELRRIGNAEAALARFGVVPALAPTRGTATRDLEQIGLAMHMFHDARKHFPPAVLHQPLSGEPTAAGAGAAPAWQPYSWRVALLPFLGQEKLYNQYRFHERWDSPANKKVLDEMPEVYRHPGAPPDSTNAAYYVLTGPGTVFEGERGSRFVDITDGTSSTILVVEAKRDVPWTKPEDIPFDPEKPLPELGGFAPGGFHAVLADTSTRFIPETMDEEMLRAAIQKADGQKVVWPESPPASEPNPSPEAGPTVSGGNVSPLFQPQKPPQGSRGSAD